MHTCKRQSTQVSSTSSQTTLHLDTRSHQSHFIPPKNHIIPSAIIYTVRRDKNLWKYVVQPCFVMQFLTPFNSSRSWGQCSKRLWRPVWRPNVEKPASRHSVGCQAQFWTQDLKGSTTSHRSQPPFLVYLNWRYHVLHSGSWWLSGFNLFIRSAICGICSCFVFRKKCVWCVSSSRLFWMDRWLCYVKMR